MEIAVAFVLSWLVQLKLKLATWAIHVSLWKRESLWPAAEQIRLYNMPRFMATVTSQTHLTDVRRPKPISVILLRGTHTHSLDASYIAYYMYVVVRPLSTVEYTSVVSGLTNLIHDRCSCTLFTLSSVSSSACLFHAWKVSSRGCVHSSVNKAGANGEWVTTR